MVSTSTTKTLNYSITKGTASNSINATITSTPGFNRNYLGKIPGILKVLELFLAVLALGLLVSVRTQGPLVGMTGNETNISTSATTATTQSITASTTENSTTTTPPVTSPSTLPSTMKPTAKLTTAARTKRDADGSRNDTGLGHSDLKSGSKPEKTLPVSQVMVDLKCYPLEEGEVYFLCTHAAVVTVLTVTLLAYLCHTVSAMIVPKTTQLESIGNLVLALLLLAAGLQEIAQTAQHQTCNVASRVAATRYFAGVMALINALLFVGSFVLSRKELAGPKVR